MRILTGASRGWTRLLGVFAAAAWLFPAGAEARHWQWAFEADGHAMPTGSQYVTSEDGTVTCGQNCQPLIMPPPNPDPASGACEVQDAITGIGYPGTTPEEQQDAQFAAKCRPFTDQMAEIRDAASDPNAAAAAVYSKGSCCLQYEIGKQGWRGYQLRFGPYEMREGVTVNDEFTIGWAKVPNAANLANDGSSYEYMVGFEFWQHTGSHHFIMDDLLGPHNDPDNPRNCAADPNAPNGSCAKFASLPDACPSETGGGKGPRTNGGSACSFGGGGMSSFPLAGSPGPSYFPVPYPDGVGIKISREHIFRMTHHIQDWFTPQLAQVWINIYTVAAKQPDGNGGFEEGVSKEAHVFFDGSGSVFLVPPHTIGRTQGLWVAPRNILLYGLTAHSHKRNILFAADLVGVDGEVKSLPVRQYEYSSPVCGGFDKDDTNFENPPMHLYESIDWAEHEQCPWWREDGSNDEAGAVFIRQGEGIRYECIVNNGIMPRQILEHPAMPPQTGEATIDPLLANAHAGASNATGSFPARTLAFQSVPIQPVDGFGEPVRGKFSCEEIPGVVPGFPGAGALGYYHSRPCLPDALKPLDMTEDFSTPEAARAALEGGPAEECKPEDEWHQFCAGYCSPGVFPFKGNYTGKCVPAAIGFAETEDDEMCILLGLYAFADNDDDLVADDLNDDVVPIGKNGPLGPLGVDRLPTDVGR